MIVLKPSFFSIKFILFHRAFVRILCVCCPRKIRRKYQPTMRSKASQVTKKRHIIHSNGFICLMFTNSLGYIFILLLHYFKIL